MIGIDCFIFNFCNYPPHWIIICHASYSSLYYISSNCETNYFTPCLRLANFSKSDHDFSDDVADRENTEINFCCPSVPHMIFGFHFDLKVWISVANLDCFNNLYCP